MYKTIKSWLCVLLAATMLCTNTEMIVFAAEGMEQNVIAEAMEGDLSEDTQTSNTLEEGLKDGDAEEEIEISEEMPVEEDAEGEETEDDSLAEDSASEEMTNDEDGEGLENGSIEEENALEEENDIEDVKIQAEDSEEISEISEDGIIASGEYKEDGNDITWVIDADGKLTVEGTGDFAPVHDDYHTSHYYAPWYDWRTSIKLAEINVTGMTDASCMFDGCKNLVELDLSNFDTSNVTDMDGMFAECSGLTSLNLSNFDTSNVTNMFAMFRSCNNLISLDLSNFDTGNVREMQSMFRSCNNLTSLDLSNFDTSNVTDMNFMFISCSSLTSLDLSSFDTGNVTEMGGMFSGCSNLTSLDLSNFNTSNVTYMQNMFYGCSGLTSLDLSNFDTSKVTNISGMFWKCSNLTSLNINGLDISKIYNVSDVFTDCINLVTINTPLCLTKSIALPGNSTDIWYQLDGTEITELPKDLSCSTVIRKNELPVLTSAITVTKAKTTYGCGEIVNVDDLIVTYYDANGIGTKIANGYSTNIDEIDMSVPGKKILKILYNGMTAMVQLAVKESFSGSCGDISWVIDTNGKLTVEGNGNFSCSDDSVKAPWSLYGDDILSAEVKVNNMTDTSYMFKGCKYLTNINFTGFDTSKVTDMSCMFHGCVSLTSLDLSGFDTSNVTKMQGMFDYCISLTSLDLSNFDTSNVTEMSAMFGDCYSLTSLDLSSFDTSNATSMVSMFLRCSGLTSLNLSSFDTSNVTDMRYMFSECSSLTSLDLSSFETSNVIYVNNFFTSCNELQTIHTPYNLTLSVALPSGTWYRPDGTEITELPQNLDHSILIRKEEISVIPATIKASITKTSYTCGDIINLDDLTVTYYDSDGIARELAIGDYTTNVNEIDMFTEGTKMLVITYGELTTTVELIVTGNGIGQIEPVVIPTASPESGRQLTIGSQVTLACETTGAEIYYTTSIDVKGLTDPTEDSMKYTSPIIVNADTYIRAVAVKGTNRSKFIDLHYTIADIEDKVLKPYASPEQGAVENGTKVELKSDTPDAEIYYITGGNADMLGAVPVDDDYKYTEPIEITKDMAIKAIAVKDGMEDSDFSVFVYRINIALGAPAAYPAAGTIDQGSYIALNAESDVNIYYTMDRSDPVRSGSAKLYESRIRVDGEPGSDIVIKAAAEKKGVYSETVTFTYTVSDSTVKGLQVMLAGSEEFTYTGSAITPAVIVTNNGEELVEGEDYTVRYSNNIKAADKNASKAPKITVTGKGNLTKSRSITFTIKSKDIGDEEEVVGGNIVVVSGKTASPILYYDGVKLTAKDFVNPNAKKKYVEDETITITGKGNFEGTRDIDVRVVEKKDMKKFAVVIDSKALKREPLIYDGEEKTMDGYFEVYDTADKSSPLEEYSDYAVIYPKNNINAGKVKFTVVGLGEYYGTVTKSYTIKPRVVKTEADGYMEVNVDNGDEYPFTSGGVTIPDLTVTCDGDVLVLGKDYKVTYSNNKKICSNNKAKCTISFKGNYKGSKSLVRKFNITAAVMDDVDKINETVSVAVADMVYTGKPGAYKSIPYVTVNGVLLKSSDYKVSYYKDVDREQVIDGKTASSSVNLTDRDKQTVYMKIEGKGNYEGTLTAEYNVYKLAEDAIDLSKAKITIVGGNKAVYTGEGVSPAIEVKYKSGREWKVVDADDIGTYVTVTYINNVNKGKATVMINGNGDRYVGSRTAIFSIVAKSMK